MVGRGKYDDICRDLMIKLKARGMFILVLGGEKGDGFSAHVLTDELPFVKAILEMAASTISQDIKYIEAEGITGEPAGYDPQ